jgi:hypothetical protein
MIGSRRYISRDQINAIIAANTHTGYQPSRQGRLFGLDPYTNLLTVLDFYP